MTNDTALCNREIGTAHFCPISFRLSWQYIESIAIQQPTLRKYFLKKYQIRRFLIFEKIECIA